MSIIERLNQLSDQKKFQLSMWTFAVTIITAVTFILVILSINRFYNFKNEITGLVKTSAITASREIEATIYELQRDVAVFTAENAELLAKFYEEKDTQSIEYQNLVSALRKRVPNMSTYTITNEDGTEILDPTNPEMSDACKIDVQDFVLNSYQQNIHVHPDDSKYHFDIMIPFVGMNNKILVFFVSFYTNDIIRIINDYSNPNYDLVITNSVHPNLIEISKIGTRQDSAAPYYLKNEILSYSVPINNTSWEAAVILKRDLFSSQIKSIITDALIMFFIFVLACAPMYIMIQRQAKKRHEAVVALKSSESHFYDLYEHAPDTYMTISKHGEIISANKHAREYFSIDSINKKNNNFFNYIYPDDVHAISKPIPGLSWDYSCFIVQASFGKWIACLIGRYSNWLLSGFLKCGNVPDCHAAHWVGSFILVWPARTKKTGNFSGDGFTLADIDHLRCSSSYAGFSTN
jgi:PAS domain-containing protein